MHWVPCFRKLRQFALLPQVSRWLAEKDSDCKEVISGPLK